MEVLNMNDRHWKWIGRVSDTISIIIGIPALLSIVFTVIIIISNNINYLIPIWMLIINTIIMSFFGIMIGLRLPRRTNKAEDKFERKQYFNVNWDINYKKRVIKGPFCLSCKVRMVYEKMFNAALEREFYTFICRNPECERKGNGPEGLDTMRTPEECFERVLDKYEAELK
jgi:hypothetical protein